MKDKISSKKRNTCYASIKCNVNKAKTDGKESETVNTYIQVVLYSNISEGYLCALCSSYYTINLDSTTAAKCICRTDSFNWFLDPLLLCYNHVLDVSIIVSLGAKPTVCSLNLLLSSQSLCRNCVVVVRSPQHKPNRYIKLLLCTKQKCTYN